MGSEDQIFSNFTATNPRENQTPFWLCPLDGLYFSIIYNSNHESVISWTNSMNLFTISFEEVHKIASSYGV